MELASSSQTGSGSASQLVPGSASALASASPFAARAQEETSHQGHHNIHHQREISYPKQSLKQLLRKRGQLGVNWGHVKQCIAANPCQVTEHLLRKVMHMDMHTQTDRDIKTEIDRKRQTRVKEEVIISMVDILQVISVKTLEVAFFRMTASTNTSCSLSTSATVDATSIATKITHGLSNEVKKYLLSHCNLIVPWYKCSCLYHTSESSKCKKPTSEIAMVSHLLFSYGCKHAWKYLTIPEFLACMFQLLEVQVQVHSRGRGGQLRQQKQTQNEGKHDQEDYCEACVICYVTIIECCIVNHSNDGDANRNSIRTSVSSHQTQADYIKALLFYLLHDDGDIGRYIGSYSDSDSHANIRIISMIKSAARRQLNSRILLDMVEESWLFCYLLSIYPQCLHETDDDGRYLLYDLANYNPSMVGILPLVLGRCLQLEVGASGGEYVACPLGGLLCRPRPNHTRSRTKRQDGHAENDVGTENDTAFERLLCTDYHWDIDYPMEVLDAVLQVAKTYGGMELLTTIQMELIHVAINLQVQGRISKDLFPAIADYFFKGNFFTNLQKPLIEMMQSTKRLPLHHAISKGMKWNGGIDILFSLHFEALHVVDGNTGLYPFLLSAASNHDDDISNCDLTCIFKLARADPGLLRVHY